MSGEAEETGETVETVEAGEAVGGEEVTITVHSLFSILIINIVILLHE